MSMMMLAREIDAGRRQQNERRGGAPVRTHHAVREPVGLFLASIGLRLASPARGAKAFLDER